jgi:hypothetical protein
MTGGGKTNILDVLREAVTAMDDAVLVSLNGAGSGDERAWEPLSLLTAAGLQDDDPGVREKIMGALRWVRHLIGERAETTAQNGDSVFQPTPDNPAVVVIADEIDETAKPEGASTRCRPRPRSCRRCPGPGEVSGQRAVAELAASVAAPRPHRGDRGDAAGPGREGRRFAEGPEQADDSFAL